jgi:hypothetical protein
MFMWRMGWLAEAEVAVREARILRDGTHAAAQVKAVRAKLVEALTVCRAMASG